MLFRSQVLIEQRGHILHVALNRPDKKNALTHAMYTALADAIDRVENDPGLRVTFITGTARSEARRAGTE